MAKYRVIAIDGGGIRGIITTVLLQRLVATPGLERMLGTVDLVSGTSTGGLLALAIAKGMDLEVIREVYVKDGPKIFADQLLDDIIDLGKIIGADYSIKPLERVLNRVFGDTKLSQLSKRVLITAFDLDNEADSPQKRTWKPKLFHNFPGRDSDGNELARKVGAYTSAAPTYFPSVDGYIDGGVFAGNPAMCALAQTQDRRASQAKLEDVVLLSLGTGTNLQYIKGKNLDWGLSQWVQPLISLMFDGVSGIADFQCRQFLDSRYHRLAPVVPAGTRWPMDEVRVIPDMIEFASKVDLSETVRWLKQHWV